jgi:hypothetical protein
MPVASTLVVGQQWRIVNLSTASITVVSSGLNNIQTMETNTQIIVTCILASGTDAASWHASYSPLGAIPVALGGTGTTTSTGSGSVVLNTSPSLSSPSLTTPTMTTPTISTGTASTVPYLDASKNLVSSAVTPTQLGYVDATSSIQTQLDAKTLKSTLTTKGDTYVATGASTVVRQAIGSNYQTLMADSGQTNGLQWVNNYTSFDIQNLSLACSVAGNALTIAVKTASGSDATSTTPILVAVRSATLNTGTYTMRAITGALSLVISSGSTLGHSSAITHAIYVYLIDNAGTLELAASSIPYSEANIYATTAEGGAGAADSASVIYSTTARSNIAMRMVGVLLSQQSTAGTWANVPTTVQVGTYSDLKDIQTISCRYGTNAANNVANATLTYVDYEDKMWDLTGLISGAGSGNVTTTNTGFKFIAPLPGRWLFTASGILSQSTGWADTESFFAQVYKNGSNDGMLWEIDRSGSASNVFSGNVGGSVVCNAAVGDRFEIGFYQDSGAGITIHGDNNKNYITITWLGY